MIYPRAAKNLTLCLGLLPCALIRGLMSPFLRCPQATAGAGTSLVTVPILALHCTSPCCTGLLPALRSAGPSNPPATCKTWDSAQGKLRSRSSTTKQQFHTPGPAKAPEVL